MRIAQIAPLAESVPPKLYGGTERVVAWLVHELVELGHQAQSCSRVAIPKRAQTWSGVWPRALRLGGPRTDPMAAQAMLLKLVAQQVLKFDVVHCHIDWVQLPLLNRIDVPYLTTCHGRLDLPGCLVLLAIFLAPRSYRFRTINVSRYRRPIGLARFIMGFYLNCFRPSSRESTLHLWAAWLPRKAPRLLFG